MKLVPLELRLPRRSGSLRAQVEAALLVHGRPLRWAITGVESQVGQPAELLCVEAVLIAHGDGAGAGVVGSEDLSA
jgi:hypothetical protein